MREYSLIADRHALSIRERQFHTAQVCAVVMNSQGGKGKGVAFSVEDFMPKSEKPVQKRGQRQTPEQQAAMLAAFAASFGGS